MACGLALKRPHGHEYESYLADEGGYGGDAKRARTSTHCPPFRPQMGTIAASLPSTSNFAKVVKAEENSPFAYIAERFRLSTSQLDSYIRSEVKSLKRRKLIPKTSGDGDGSMASSSNDVTCRKIYRAPKSPAQSGSDSDEDAPTNSNKAKDALKEAKFTIAQVSLICDRLMKEQETRMRYEFEAELRKKLDEQHEQYVQFCAEQLSNNRTDTTENDYSYSYLS